VESTRSANLAECDEVNDFGPQRNRRVEITVTLA
jgi:hypothetical protein